MKRLTYYTDGGCDPNPGRGAWAFVCLENNQTGTGHDGETTNNRMEMMSVIQAAEHGFKQDCTNIYITSDSKYVVKGFNEWMYGWEKNGWKKRGDGNRMVEVKNVDLWKRLYEFRHVVKLRWVKGHNGDHYNEMCDTLVKQTFAEVFNGTMTH